MLAIGAVLAVAAVVIAVQYGRLGGPAPPVLPPDAPPEGVQLVYARNPANAHGLIAYDWTGARRGSTKFPTWVPIASLRPTPDGSAFFIDPASPGDYAAYFDRTGRILFETNEEGFMSQVWADDSAHACVLVNAGGIELIRREPGQADRGALTSLGDQFAITACGLHSDAAVLASQDQVAVVRVSTGAILRTSSLPAGGAVVASTDATYVAVSAMGTEPVAIYRAADLSRPAATLDSGLAPFAFSGDDSLLLAGQADGSGPVEAIDWRTGKVVWRYGAGTANVELVVARPSAADLAIYAGSSLVIVHRDGTSVQIG